MKKFIVGILAILYMTSSTGATLHMHYCMGKLVDMSLFGKQADQCPRCESKKKVAACSKKCCRDEHKLIKIEKDQKYTEASFQLIGQTSIAILINYIDLPPAYFTSAMQEFPVGHGPPRSCKVHPYILNRTFRI